MGGEGGKATGTLCRGKSSRMRRASVERRPLRTPKSVKTGRLEEEEGEKGGKG